MPDPTTDAALDAELRHIAEALVAEAPDEVPPFPYASIVVERSTRPATLQRRPRRAAIAAAAAVVVALGAFALSIDGSRDGEDGDDDTESVIAGDAGLEPAPQRLLLDGGKRELLPDGEVVPLEQAGLDGAARPLAGGGHVVVGVHPIDEPPPEGFNEMTDMIHGLAVVNAAGEVEIERTIERSVLVGVTDGEAVLSRQPIDDRGDPSGPVTILVHDLATGDERVVRRGADVDPDARVEARSAVVGSDLVTVESRRDTVPSGDDGGRIVVPDSAACALRITDLATGDGSEVALDLGCEMIVGLQASPDGRRAAIAYQRWSGRWPEQRLAVIDLADGAVAHDEMLGNNITCSTGDGGCPSMDDSVSYLGMAWASATTIDVALDDLDTPFDDPTVRNVTLR